MSFNFKFYFNTALVSLIAVLASFANAHAQSANCTPGEVMAAANDGQMQCTSIIQITGNGQLPNSPEVTTQGMLEVDSYFGQTLTIHNTAVNNDVGGWIGFEKATPNVGTGFENVGFVGYGSADSLFSNALPD